ncbi:MAG: NAD-binding protein, partial [Emcibacter sp.]|nr:NAD-binding protein [Emcibacter sp.]
MKMIVGVPKEIKIHEYRVGLTPGSASEFVRGGHKVIVETGAGAGIGFSDDDYRAIGADIIATAAEVFAMAEMIVKVKEPQLSECEMLTENHLLYTYLHLAADPAQTDALMKSGCTAIAYETVTNEVGGLPLLAPMSEVAGRMSIQAGAHALEKAAGGMGILLGGVPGVAPAKVVIIGGGVSGMNAAEMAVGLGADVSVFDRNIDVLRRLDARFRGTVKTRYSTAHDLEEAVLEADLVIGTHALFQEKVAFRDLALAVVDEQHRFGVHQRLALQSKGRHVDLLVMTATPIPRTLALTLYGDMDVTRLVGKPAGRQPVKTAVMPMERLGESLEHLRAAVERGTRAYWICPLVEESDRADIASAEERHAALMQALPGRVGLVHGRMKGEARDA